MRTSAAVLGALLVACGGADDPVPADVGGDAAAAGGLRVVLGEGGARGKIVDASGATVRLHGADRAGTEYACLYGGVFSGPADQASIDAMKAWHVNAVRVPLNEDCWLGINLGGMPNAIGGAAYRDAIRAWVSLLETNGMYVVLDLHWAAPGDATANGQLGMADADHAPVFWAQVAAAYAGDHAQVLFDLFNEPFITDWDCWLDGGACADDDGGQAFQTSGMAALLAAVRGAGADNVVLLGGLGYASDFTRWVDEVRSIEHANVAASWHAYSDQSVQTLCPTQYNGYTTSLSCADGATTAANYGITGVLDAGFPVVIGEIGIGAYADDIAPYTPAQGEQLAAWLESTLAWADGQGQSYLAWDWNTEAPPLLIRDFDGTPTPYFGATYRAHLAGL